MRRAAFRVLLRLLRVDKRPSDAINMKLLSLSRGAVHGYRCDDYEACNTVE
jgi:hypothetical protein